MEKKICEICAATFDDNDASGNDAIACVTMREELARSEEAAECLQDLAYVLRKRIVSLALILFTIGEVN